MAKSTATKTKSASAQPEPENVVVSEVAPSEKKVKKVKSTASKESAPAVPVVESVVPAEATPEVENNLLEKSMEFVAKMHQMNNMMTSLKSDFKVIEKAWSRELKASQKLNTKRKRKSGNRAPSGFVKPTRISDELAKFLEKQGVSVDIVNQVYGSMKLPAPGSADEAPAVDIEAVKKIIASLPTDKKVMLLKSVPLANVNLRLNTAKEADYVVLKNV